MAPPVIVLGVGRSGTTLLRVMLDRSSQIAIPYESFFVTPLAHRHGRRPQLDEFVDDLGRFYQLYEWGISPERVVLTGFSAGAILTSAVVLQPDARPNYAAPIYGGPYIEVPPIPQGLPPIFLAVAQDDASAEPLVTRFYDALKAAGYKPELHVFSGGGHGFGMRKQGKSSDHWIDEFYFWLESLGLTRPTK